LSTPLSLQNKWNRLYERQRQGKLSADDRLDLLIQTGLDAFGMEAGLISHISGSKFTVLYSASPATLCLQYPLQETYCDITVACEEILAIQHIEKSPFAQHPSYARFKLEAYFGIPLWVRGKIFGTLAFTQSLPRLKRFSTSERDLLQSLAKSAAGFLEEELATT
jgi:GAF domain-containing protein